VQSQSEAPAKEPLSFGLAGVELERVGRTYPPASRRGRPVQALDGLSLSIAPGEVVAVVGPSGCGKSTLLQLVAGLQQPDAGSIAVAGTADAPARLRSCSYMPQRDLLLPWRDGLGNAALALECGGMGGRDARVRAEPLFQRFGLAEFEHTRPAQLSGGMRQRVAFLRTLLPGRPVLLLDEPFAALDSITRADMQEWLAGALAAEPRTVLAVTHDVEEALFLADRVAVLSPRPGRVVEDIAVDIPRPRPRRETVTDPAFVEMRERALKALAR
jgi:NitT/TauT family transport system ATP-binding protein